MTSVVNFQKMWIPLFMLYSKFLFGRHTNPQRAMLQDFAEVRIDFRNFLKSSLLRESTKKVHLNFRVSLWKRKFKDFDIRRSFSNIFFGIKNRVRQTKTNDCYSNRSIIEYRSPQGSILSPLYFDINVIYILYYYEDSEIKNYAVDTTPYSCATEIPHVNRELQFKSTIFLTGSIIIMWDLLLENSPIT